MKRLIAAAIVTAVLACGAPTSAQGALPARLTKLATGGNAEAAYHLGMLAHTGTGMPRDSKTAFLWFTKAAAGGDPLGAYKVGCFYAGQGEGIVADDPDKAIKYKLVAAKAGYSLAQYDVGAHFAQRGRFTDALWFKLAAVQGYPMALFAIASLTARPDTGVTDATQAYTNYKLAKLMTEGRVSPAARDQLDKLGRRMSKQQLAEAERIVRAYAPKPSELTKKALSGVGAAERLATAE